MKNLQHGLLTFTFSIGLLSSFGFTWPFHLPAHNDEPFGTTPWIERQVHILKARADNIDEHVLRLSLIAYTRARQRGLDQKQILTVIDYSKPSTEKRLWVFDLRNNHTLYNTWVSHGKNSGNNLNATSFSNNVGSLKSSIGVFVTEHPYFGGDGYSLRLSGLERGINDNAYRRNIVIHGARYVNPDTISSYARVGRSWGCPAVNLATAKPLINAIKEHTLMFAYYPDQKWLSHSQFLTG